MKLTPHFSLAELTVTGTGLDNTPTREHLPRLLAFALCMEQVRALINAPIIFTSAYRSPKVNKAVGGVATSDHPQGWAGDWHTPAMSCRRAAELIVDSRLVFDQLILERNERVIHLSFNPRLRRDVLRQPGGPGTKFLKGL